MSHKLIMREVIYVLICFQLCLHVETLPWKFMSINSFHFVFLIWRVQILVTWLKQRGFKNKMSTCVTFMHWSTKNFLMKAGICSCLSPITVIYRVDLLFLCAYQIYFIECVGKKTTTHYFHEARVWSTSENVDVFNTWEELFLEYLPRKVNFLFISYIRRIMLNISRFKA